MQNYGRVPVETAALIQRLVQQVRDEVLPGLPGTPSHRAEAHALEAILGVVLRDWRENGNTDGLTADDVADLKSFLVLAHGVAGSDPYGRGTPIFEATLDGMLEDWLANWNADGQSGPPRR